MAKMKTLSVYRQLLKASKMHIGKGDGKMIPFGDYISEEFRRNAKLSDETGVQRKLQLAHNYAFLLQSVQHHKELLFCYNIAVDRSNEMQITLNKSAASVGLQLPDVYQP